MPSFKGIPSALLHGMEDDDLRELHTLALLSRLMAESFANDIAEASATALIRSIALERLRRRHISAGD